MMGPVLRAGQAFGSRRRALQLVSPQLRSPVLWIPASITNRRILHLARGLAPIALRGRTRRGVEVRSHTIGRSQLEVLRFGSRDVGGASPALLWFHGGGTILGTPDLEAAWCSKVATELGVAVFSVDYRLAPEHPFPAGLDDCFDALTWLHGSADALGVDLQRIAVGGESAGGGLAAAVAQRALDEGVPVCFQLLEYPMLDDRTGIDSAGRDVHFVWTARSNRFAWNAYLGRSANSDSPPTYASAARREDVSGLAPAWIGVGELDLFRAEDAAYAPRLVGSGVDCVLWIEPGMYHGADLIRGDRAPAMRAFQRRMLEALACGLGLSHPGGSS
jgi:acetyl esterase/lipase